MVDYGLRVGSVITLDNVHIINERFWRGFYCCIVSHLLIVSFSTGGTNHHQVGTTCTCSLIHYVCTDLTGNCFDTYTCTYAV